MLVDKNNIVLPLKFCDSKRKKKTILGKRTALKQVEIPKDEKQSKKPAPFWVEECMVISKQLEITKSSKPIETLNHNKWFNSKTFLVEPKETKNNKAFEETVKKAVTKYKDDHIPAIKPPKPKRQKKEKDEKEPKKKTVKKKEPKEPAGKNKKIRIYFTKEQEQTIKKWIVTTRWTYNQCLEAVKKKKAKQNKKELRAYCLNEEAFGTREFEDCKWVLDTPYPIRDEGMIDLLKAYKTNYAKGVGRKFDIKFRTKKAPQESIVIHSRAYNGTRSQIAKIFKNLKKVSEELPRTIQYDSRLIRTRLNHYYLCIPAPLKIQTVARLENQESSKIVSLDPGVRTFQTCYEPNGLVHEWGSGDMGRIYRLCNTISKLQSRWSQKETRHRKRYRLKKAAKRIHLKIRNLIDDVHKKMVKWLLSNYDIVLLPFFETQRMVNSKFGRKINSKTARAMLTWAHYRFKQRLLFKNQEYPHCKVLIVDEAYTSKTCGQCGKIHEKLYGNKVFKCPSCDFTWSRDWNGARNILLKFLVENTKESDSIQSGHVGTFPFFSL